jgi:hypothetical protein
VAVLLAISRREWDEREKERKRVVSKESRYQTRGDPI